MAPSEHIGLVRNRVSNEIREQSIRIDHRFLVACDIHCDERIGEYSARARAIVQKKR